MGRGAADPVVGQASGDVGSGAASPDDTDAGEDAAGAEDAAEDAADDTAATNAAGSWMKRVRQPIWQKA